MIRKGFLKTTAFALTTAIIISGNLVNVRTVYAADKKTVSASASDNAGLGAERLTVELKKGTHEFLITVNEGTFLLGDITLSAPGEPAAYKGSADAPGDELITINAIDFYERNDSSIHAAAEYNSKLYPLSSKETVLNILDGSFIVIGPER